MNSTNREGYSYWRKDYPSESLYPELSQDLEVDVVIVGAGITGLTAAYLLKQSGKKVVVLDKDTVGGGTTGRTTGKVTSQHSLIYEDLQNRLGTETAKIYGQANEAAVLKVDEIVRQNKFDCEWTRQDNYVYTSDEEQIETFKKEAQVAAELGLPATFETSSPLPFEIKAAVKFSNQGYINAQKYALALAEYVNGDGCFVFENSNVIGIRDGQPGRVKTKKASVKARDIIIATNVPTMPLLARGGYCILEYPTESYIIAGVPDKELKGMYISPDEDNYSILPVNTDNEPMILIGGGGHISGMRLSKQKRYDKLASYARYNFGVKEIQYKWSDRDYIGYDGIPIVGKMYPWSKHLYVASAFRKWGLTNGTVSAMILHDLILGTENPWAKVFDSSRSGPIKSIPRVAAKYLLPGS